MSSPLVRLLQIQSFEVVEDDTLKCIDFCREIIFEKLWSKKQECMKLRYFLFAKHYIKNLKLSTLGFPLRLDLRFMASLPKSN